MFKSHNEDTIKLIDFGFAKQFNQKSPLTEHLGSTAFQAPEIAKQEQYDEKVDVWAVGVITHILLTGCPPFIA